MKYVSISNEQAKSFASLLTCTDIKEQIREYVTSHQYEYEQFLMSEAANVKPPKQVRQRKSRKGIGAGE